MSADRLVLVVMAVVVGASCSGRAEERPVVRQVATAFYDAFSADDGAAMCALLAPETLEDVEAASKEPCTEAVTEEALPADLGTVTATDVFGSEARVQAENDTVFIADFDGDWKVVAAGCTERPDRPYDCTIGGG